MSAAADVRPGGPLRGSVPARAFLFDPRLLGDGESRRRVIARWTPGSRVVKVDGAFLLVLASELRARCELSPGLPFVSSGGRLLAVSVAVDALDGPRDALVWLDQGRLRCEPLSAFAPVDVSRWLDPGPAEVVRLEPLARPPEAPRLSLDDPPPLDARARLGVAAASQESANLRRLLLGGRPAAAADQRRGPGAFTRLAQALRSLVPVPGRARPAAPYLPAARPWWLALRSFFDRLLFHSRLAQVIGRQHAKYLRRMLDLFERGDVQDALRHAIPLGNDLETKLQSWALPRPRGSLAIRPRVDAATSAWNLGGDLYQHLQRTYRAMFQRLEAQGRLEEAAFVLAELLCADAEAVAFLERHGRLKLAAELAEGRKLPPGLQVRQWFLAGERARALALALRHGAFAEAALHLDKSGRAEDARAWRLLWADALADAGDALGAAEVVAGIPEARALAMGWLDVAIAQGGPTGARALVRQLGLRPDAFPRLRERAVALLADTRVEDVPTRVAFAEAVSVGRRGPELSVFARMAARTIVRDLGQHGPGRLPAKTVDRLVAVADDGALRADVPPLPDRRPAALAAREDPLLLEWPQSDVGRMAVTDAALLPDGRVVAALGEIGLRLLHRDGRVLAHFDQPAHQLVVADGGDRLIALAPRGETQRLARIDLMRRRAESWCEAPVRRFAADFDGRRWFVGVEHDLYAIDAVAPRFDALWQVPDLTTHSILRGGERLHVLGDESEGRGPLERYSYELPSLVLRARDLLPPVDGTIVSTMVDEKGDHARSYWIQMEGSSPRLAHFFGAAVGGVTQLNADDRLVRVTREWFVITQPAPAGVTLLLADRVRHAIRLRLTLAGATHVTVRVSGQTMTLADDRGRVIVIDLLEGLVVRDLRIGSG